MDIDKIKILMKTSLAYNGISSVAMNYFKNMPFEKVKIDFAVCDNLENMRVDFIEYIKSYESKIFNLPQPQKNIFKYIMKMRKILLDEEYQIIHINGNSANMLIDIIIATSCGVKVRIAHCHNTSCVFKLQHYIFKPFLNFWVRDKFACSNAAGKWLYNNNQFMVLQNGVNFEKYRFDEDAREGTRLRYGLMGKFVLCHVGSFIDAKNHIYLIDIFSELVKINSESALILIGKGPLLENIKEKVLNLGLEEKIIFVGNSTEVEKYYNASDIFVLPSKFEGLPLVLIEAQVSGLPCVIADNITKEVDITGKIEQLSITSNSSVWANKIININNTNTRNEVLFNDNAKAFDIKKNSIELEKFYRKRVSEAYFKNG